MQGRITIPHRHLGFPMTPRPRRLSSGPTFLRQFLQAHPTALNTLGQVHLFSRGTMVTIGQGIKGHSTLELAITLVIQQGRLRSQILMGSRRQTVIEMVRI